MSPPRRIEPAAMILAAGFLVAFSVDELEIGESDMKHVFPFLTL
jgi:hypothetical protein